jgi:hypothetical protein
MTSAQMLDDLDYRLYSFNRREFPETSPERWALLFPDAAELEWRYQSEFLFPPCEMQFEREGFTCGKPSVVMEPWILKTSAGVFYTAGAMYCASCGKLAGL